MSRYAIYVKSFLQSLKVNGLYRTMQILASSANDDEIDTKYGIETSQSYDPRKEHTHVDLQSSQLYEPSRSKALKNLLKTLQLSPDLQFLDIGCGKARAMAIAAEYGFKHIIGIELSEPLYLKAKKNLETLGRHFSHVQFQLIHQSILEYEFERNEQIFYLYDPFSLKILESFFHRIARSFDEHPREIWIVYHNNTYALTKTDLTCFNHAKHDVKHVLGNRYEILHLTPSSIR